MAIRLDLPEEPYWLDLGYGVCVKVRPLTTAMLSAARQHGWQRASDLAEQRAALVEAGVDAGHLPDLSDEATRAGMAETLLIKALGRQAILDWEGVLEPDDTPAALTESAVDRLLDIHALALSFYDQYTAPLERLRAEGNGCGSAPPGTTATDPDTAPGAGTADAPAPTAAASTDAAAPTT